VRKVGEERSAGRGPCRSARHAVWPCQLEAPVDEGRHRCAPARDGRGQPSEATAASGNVTARPY